MNKAKMQNLTVGILIFAISVIAYIMTLQMPADAYMFPRLVIYLFAFLGIMLVILSLMGKYDNDTSLISLSFLKAPCISAVIILGYVSLLNVVGFYVMTTIFLITYMRFLGAKSITLITLSTLGVDVFIYLLFTCQLRVPLPAGFLM